MYRDYMGEIRAVDNFGIACGILVQSNCLDIERLLDTVETSSVVSKLIDGDVYWAASSPLAIARGILEETGTEPNSALAECYMTKTRNSFAVWLGKTELDIAIRLGKPISELRSVVSAEKLMILYEPYHPFYRTDRIISEQYHQGEQR